MGSSEPKQVDVGTGEYAAAAQRYLGDEQGGPIMDSFPADVVTYRIAITPTSANILDSKPDSRVPFRADSISWLGCGVRLSTAA